MPNFNGNNIGIYAPKADATVTKFTDRHRFRGSYSNGNSASELINGFAALGGISSNEINLSDRYIEKITSTNIVSGTTTGTFDMVNEPNNRDVRYTFGTGTFTTLRNPESDLEVQIFKENAAELEMRIITRELSTLYIEVKTGATVQFTTTLAVDPAGDIQYIAPVGAFVFTSATQVTVKLSQGSDDFVQIRFNMLP